MSKFACAYKLQSLMKMRSFQYSGRTIADLVDPRSNSLNFVRLILASAVIFWHVYPLSGRQFPLPIGESFLGEFSVDGFFVISGYLLAGSWLHSPKVVPFLRNRVLRIIPGFWVCLVVVAFVFAPVATALAHGDVGGLFRGPHSAYSYVASNLFLKMQFYDVKYGPSNVPFPEAWNGSLWTLYWEALAYIGLVVLGMLRLLRPPIILGFFVALWLFNAALALGLLAPGFWSSNGGRLGFMFVTGMLIYSYRSQIPANRWLAGMSIGLIAGSLFLSDYRILAGPALAYLVIWCGGAIKGPRFELKDHDISYGIYIYAFPVQQSLVLAGAATWPALLFGTVALISTLPLAIASWLLVERPMLRLKSRLKKPLPAA